MSALHPPWEARRVGAAQRGAARCTSRARQHARAGCGVARSADSDHHHLATAAAPVQQHARGDPALAPRLRRPGGLPHADRRRRLRGECSRGAVGTVEERQDLGGGRRAVRAAQAARACGVRGRRAALRAGGADQPTSPSKADRAVRAHLTTSPHISRHLPTSPYVSLCLTIFRARPSWSSSSSTEPSPWVCGAPCSLRARSSSSWCSTTAHCAGTPRWPR